MAKKRERENNAERPQRPALPRAEPIRSWSGLFGSGARPGSTFGAVDSVQRGVELGYRVINEYVKQGASVAGSFTGPAAARGPGATDLSGMTERMAKYASDFTSLWFDTMGQMVAAAGAGSTPNGVPAGAAKTPAAPAAAKNAPVTGEAGAVRLALHVRSRRKVDVVLTLDEATEAGRAWSVAKLSRRGTKHTISPVSIAPPAADGGPLRVSIEVPDATPAGRYSAAIVDESSGQPRGRITVVVSA